MASIGPRSSYLVAHSHVSERAAAVYLCAIPGRRKGSIRFEPAISRSGRRVRTFGDSSPKLPARWYFLLSQHACAAQLDGANGPGLAERRRDQAVWIGPV